MKNFGDFITEDNEQDVELKLNDKVICLHDSENIESPENKEGVIHAFLFKDTCVAGEDGWLIRYNDGTFDCWEKDAVIKKP